MTNPQEPQPPVYHQPPQYQQAPPPAAPKGLAISALIVGIVGFLMGLLPFIGAIVGIVAVILGAIALSKKQPKGFALTGLILGALALIASVSTTAGLGALSSELEQISSEVQVENATEPAPAEEATDEEAEPEPEPAPAPTERLTLDEGWTTQEDDSGMFINVTGYVSNNSDKAITNYVQITFDTLDAQGANLGTCLANTNTIDANGKWKFEAMCLDDASEIAEVRFKEISGF